MAHLLLDTYSLLFRAFHALPPMSTRAGEPTGALYGFSVLLLKLLREERPEGLSFALDAPQKTFRHEAYADYKGHREAVASDLARQLHALPSLLEAFDVPHFRAPGFEADDVLATVAAELSGGGASVLVVSGDRDLLQVVDGRTEVLFVGQRGKPPVRYDVAAVEARFGIPVGRLPEYVALVGDSSDNIASVPGVGPETARKLLAQHAGLADLLENVATVEPTRIRESLTRCADQVARSATLVRLRRDVPLPDGPRSAPLTEAARGRLRELFERWEFRSLIPRLDKLVVEGQRGQ